MFGRAPYWNDTLMVEHGRVPISLADESLGFYQNTSGYQKKKERVTASGQKGLQTLFQVGVHEIGYDNSSAASAVSAVQSTPEVGSTSVDDNQPSASLRTETTNPSSLQDGFQTLEFKVKYQNLRLNIRT